MIMLEDSLRKLIESVIKESNSSTNNALRAKLRAKKLKQKRIHALMNRGRKEGRFGEFTPIKKGDTVFYNNGCISFRKLGVEHGYDGHRQRYEGKVPDQALDLTDLFIAGTRIRDGQQPFCLIIGWHPPDDSLGGESGDVHSEIIDVLMDSWLDTGNPNVHTDREYHASQARKPNLRIIYVKSRLKEADDVLDGHFWEVWAYYDLSMFEWGKKRPDEHYTTEWIGKHFTRVFNRYCLRELGIYRSDYFNLLGTNYSLY